MKDVKVETVCFLIDKKMSEIMGDSDEKYDIEAKASFYISQIECVRETAGDTSEIQKDRCAIYFKSGESMIIKQSYESINALME